MDPMCTDNESNPFLQGQSNGTFSKDSRIQMKAKRGVDKTPDKHFNSMAS